MTWRGRREGGGTSSISSFNNHLSVLERTSPERQGFATVDSRPANQLQAAKLASAQGGTRSGLFAGTLTISEARRRRRMVLMGLATALLVSLMLAGVLGGPFLWLVALSAVALAAYGGLLAWTRQVQVERQQKVRYLDQPDHVSPGWEVTEAEEGLEAAAWWEAEEMPFEARQGAYASSGS